MKFSAANPRRRQKGGQAHERRNDSGVYRSGGMERRIHSGIYWRAVPEPEAETSPEKQGQIRKV